MKIERVKYTEEPFVLDPYQVPVWAPEHIADKPGGIWYSVEVDGDRGWWDWCTSEQFHPERLAYRTHFDVSDMNILHLRTKDEVDWFGRRYEPDANQWFSSVGFDLRWRLIDWRKVKEEYDGIEVWPYQWEIRFDPEHHWYYGWDCASGVVWNKLKLRVSPGERTPLTTDH